MSRFPYRYVFAVGTKKSVLFYDTQQMSPFAHVSQIHYMSISDLAWSPDGQIITITSNDGFATFVCFEENELGVPYQGKLMSIENLEPVVVSTPAKKAEPKPKVSSATKQEPKVLAKPKLVKSATPITTFFKKSSPSNENIRPNDNNNKPKPVVGRRVTLFTLSKPNKKENETKTLHEQPPPSTETNLKRKLSECEEPHVVPITQSDKPQLDM